MRFPKKVQARLTMVRLFTMLIMVMELATFLPMSATAVQTGSAGASQALFAQSGDDDDDDSGFGGDDDDDNGSGGNSGGLTNAIIIALILQLLALLQQLLRSRHARPPPSCSLTGGTPREARQAKHRPARLPLLTAADVGYNGAIVQANRRPAPVFIPFSRGCLHHSGA